MIPRYLTDATLWLTLLPIPAAAGLFGAAVYAFMRLSGSVAAARATALMLTAFLLLGLVAGYLTGLSREAAVAAVVPAVLSLLGGVAAVMIGRTNNQAASIRVSGLIFVFSLGLLVGTVWGSAMRQAVADFDSSETELMRRSHVEFKVRRFREALGLPPEFQVNDASSEKKKADKSK